MSKEEEKSKLSLEEDKINKEPILWSPLTDSLKEYCKKPILQRQEKKDYSNEEIFSLWMSPSTHSIGKPPLFGSSMNSSIKKEKLWGSCGPDKKLGEK